MANSEGGSSADESDVDSRLQDFDVDLPEKKRKPGIIYLSSVPEGMNVSQTTSFFAQFGRVGRVFLQPDKKLGFRQFTEGWIEFLSKRVAKKVAEQINNTPVGGKRRHKSYYSLWNIKYLPRFKWVHLTERLSYEQAVKQQRMRTEISQVKREAEHFKESVKQQKRKKRKREEGEGEEEEETTPNKKPFVFRQEEGVTTKTQADVKMKSKKTKKGRKTKEKDESPSHKVKSRKQTLKLAKSKKESKRTSPTAGGQPATSPNKSPRVKKKSRSRTPKKAANSSVSRRRTGDADVSASGERSAFLKSVFGGGAS